MDANDSRRRRARFAAIVVKVTNISRLSLFFRFTTVADAGKLFRGIRIENLHPSLDEEKLREYLFSQGIAPIKLKIIRNEISGISKGLALASFESHNEAVLALRKSGGSLFGTTINFFADDSLN